MTDAAMVARFEALRAERGTAGALRALIAEGARETEQAPRIVADVVAAVARRTGVAVADIMGPSIKRRVARARALCWWLLHRRAVAGADIARAWGRSRWAVNEVIDAYPARLLADELLRALVAAVDADVERGRVAA